MFKRMRSTLITALTATLVICNSAQAEESLRIDTSDLDFNSRSDMAGLYIDIVKAADEVCDTKGKYIISVRVSPSEYRRVCRKYTVQETLEALEEPVLNDIYASLPSDKRYSLTYVEQALQPVYAGGD